MKPSTKKVTTVKAEISFSNLESLIFVLMDSAAAWHGLGEDDPQEMTLGQFTDWLHGQPGNQIVQLTETRFVKDGESA